MLTCNKLSKSYGVDVVLSDISFKINENDRIGIVGKNGAGKTTLFKIITGFTEYDTGEIFIQKNCTLGYLSQSLDLNETNTIYEELLKVYKPLIELEEEIRLTQVSMGQTENLEKVMEKYNQLTEDFIEKGGYEYESRIRGMLNGLGFNASDHDKKINHLSGGQKTRIALAKLLLIQPNLLLLDEPTNYLDMDTMQWLENYLRTYKGAVIIVSHDRFFLDAIVNKIFEIENHNLTQFLGNYTAFVKKKQEDFKISVHQYETQQKEIRRQKEIIQRFRQYNREKSIRKAESREKMLEKIELMDKPLMPEKKVHLLFEPQIKSGKIVLDVSGLEKAYGDNTLLKEGSFTILRGEKIGIIGQNGTGKSTLLKMILGQISPDDGQLQLGHQVHVGFFYQEQENLDKNNNILQEVWKVKPYASEGELRNILAAFKFLGDEVYRSIATLSGGEVSRVALAKLMLSKSNFLLMDEPTNHLDMDTKEVLEDSLMNYLGTALIVSHDRYFLNRIVDKILLLENNHIYVYNGNYDYYLQKVNEHKLLIERNNQQPTLTKTKQNQLKKTEYHQKKAFKELKEKILQIENEIECTENEIKELESAMCQENFYDDYESAAQKTNAYNNAKELLRELIDQWSEKQTELEDNS
ncbi:MAG: ABC-F family ATP-binding cassette domain-containing protein [Eubacteriales bacterium]